MEAQTTRLGGTRSSTRHGPAAVFSGRVRKWQKKWTKSGHQVYRWVLQSTSPAKEPEPEKVQRLHYLPVAVVMAKMAEMEARRQEEAIAEEERQRQAQGIGEAATLSNAATGDAIAEPAEETPPQVESDAGVAGDEDEGILGKVGASEEPSSSRGTEDPEASGGLGGAEEENEPSGSGDAEGEDEAVAMEEGEEGEEEEEEGEEEDDARGGTGTEEEEGGEEDEVDEDAANKSEMEHEEEEGGNSDSEF